MTDIVNELKKIINFKDTTTAGDIVLIVAEESQFVGYALVTGIEKDQGRKKDWWNVHMQLLTVPPSEVSWTLREPQFTGQETFTMDGEPRFVKAVSFDNPPGKQDDKTGIVKHRTNTDVKKNPFHIVK